MNTCVARSGLSSRRKIETIMRLTNKETKIKLSDTKRYDLQDHKMFIKLSELEDIEETLGIDLRDLIAILTGSIFVNTELGIYELNGSMCYIGRKDKALCCYFDAHGKFLPFKDYGTYWSANREDVVKWRKENGWE